MEILKQQFEVLPGIGGGLWIPGIVELFVTHTQLEDMENLGLDAEARSGIANEVYLNISQLVSKTVFLKEFKNIKWKRKEDWLSQIVSKKSLFILTNVKLAIAIQNMWGLNVKSLKI